jgi:hypothetical protein
MTTNTATTGAGTFNLDVVKRPKPTAPFVVLFGGREYELIDAQECDYRELIEAQVQYQKGDPSASIGKLLAEEDVEAFFANQIPTYKLRALFSAYNEHYGIGQGDK